MGLLDGRVVLVTGASRGIGAAIARRLAIEGARIAVCARTVSAADSSLPGTVGDTARRIAADGGEAEPFPADLASAEQRESVVAAVFERFGRIDVLVNNAAVATFAPVAEFPARRQALMFEVQVTAPVHLAQLVLPGMRERGQGWILNISSRAARHPRSPRGGFAGRGDTVHGMCKAALERFTTGLAGEVADDGIAVNALAPDQVVPTPGTLFHKLTGTDDPDAEPPEVMAEAALALCTRPPEELTGRIAYSQELLAELDR